ncbi:MAG TPA: hypothetical protein VNA04_10660 [Thermoanaerobaculia bacterium]|nr:hypothetical protein [Thermoanaerobaculia bacterium]
MGGDFNLTDDLRALAGAARARVRIGYPRWLRLLLWKGVAGITLGRRIYVASGLTQAQLERIIRHELAHVRQIARHGLIAFYWRYLVEYLRHRRRGLPAAAAYRSISFEEEALAAEETV